MDERLPRRLAAILYADVAGYSLHTGNDEDATHRSLSEHLDLISRLVEAHRGQVMHYAGDAVLAMFDAVVDAVSCAAEIQDQLKTRNLDVPDQRKLQFRIGINLGDVIEDRGDIYGDGVNIAARLEALSEPGRVCISESVKTAVGKKLPLKYVFIGEQWVKNIADPIRAYSVFAQDDNVITDPKASISATRPRIGKPSITIKPFENIGHDPEQDYFAVGLTWDIYAALMKIPGMFLVEGGSSAHDPGKMTVQELGECFGVRYVLQGGVRRSGDRVRVNSELVETATGQKVWGDRYDGDLHDLFAIQDEITEEIVTCMDIKLLGGEQARFKRKEIKNDKARDNMYRADLLMYSSNRQDVQEAEALYEEVIKLEPDSSLSYAMTAMAYWLEVYGWPDATPPQALERALKLSHDALEMGDTSGYPHLILAHTHLQRREFDQALTESNLATVIRPSCNGAYSLKAGILIYLGRASEAIDLARYAVRLKPVNPSMYPAILASAYYGSHHYEEAINAAKETIEIDDQSIDPYLVLAASCSELGYSDEARNASESVLKLNPDFKLKDFAETQPYKNQEDLDRLLGQLRRAGFK